MKYTQDLTAGDVIIGFKGESLTVENSVWAGGDNYRVIYRNAQSETVEAIERVNSIFTMKESN
jgi:ribosomal protein S28E/S33